MYRPSALLYRDEDIKTECASASESEAKLGMAELVLIFKTGQEDVDPFNDPAEETRESLDRSKYALFKDFTGENGREAKRILGESAAYASAVMRTQYRTFCYIVLLFGNKFRIVRWDRAGAIVTRAVDYRKKPKVLFEFLWRYKNAGPIDRGFDVSHVDATVEERECLRAVIRKNVLLQYFNTDEDGVEAQNISADELEKKMAMHYQEDRVAKIPIFDEITGTVQHCLVSFPCKAPTNIIGSGTRGFWGAKWDAGTSQWKLVFVKDTWRDTDMEKEGDMYANIGAVKGKDEKGKSAGARDETKPTKARPANVPIVLCHGDVQTTEDGNGIPEAGSKSDGTTDSCKFFEAFS